VRDQRADLGGELAGEPCVRPTPLGRPRPSCRPRISEIGADGGPTTKPTIASALI
jgi:hypothetical protein